jgi:4-hydroxybenzoate polyprenyltransferase
MKNTDMKTKHSIKSYFELLRPHQWIKNVLIFAAIIFSHNLLKIPMLLNSLTGFSIFCMVSSCVYIINDIADREKDRQHPKKCRRPIARGTVSVRNAVLLLMMLLCISFIGAFTLEYRFGLVISLYFIMNIAYSFRLKHMPILDIMCIAIGFVLRTVSGSFIIGTDVSPWMLMCVFLLAMFLALHKRCSEIEANGTATRKVLEMYSADMLHEMISAVDGAVIIVYSLYCFFTTDTLLMMLTIPFVVYGLFRYIFITYKFGDLAETPEAAIIRDRPLLINIALWGILCIVIMFSYGGGVK